MPTILTNPAGLPEVPTYRPVSVSTGPGLVFIAGQTALDADRNTVGDGDLAAQVHLDLHTALVEAVAVLD